MTKNEVMQQALELIERLNMRGWILADFEDEVYATIDSLKAALIYLAEDFPIIELGYGLIEVAEGNQGDKPALIFGKNGSGKIGEPTKPNRMHEEGETLAVVTFENAASLDIVVGKLKVLRDKHFPKQPPLPVQEDSCFCHSGVSLQSVSGGAAPEGYLGKVTLLIDGENVDYVKAQPVPHAVIVGALFDFMGWLTTRKERLILSSTDNASPAADAIKDFAEMRGLSLDDARVQDWQNYTATPQQQAEPVAWDKPSDSFNEWWDSDRRRDNANPFTTESFAYWAWEGWQAALAQRPWVGLTEEEIEAIGDKVANERLVGPVSNFRVRLAQAIEQTLKERNT